ncbi:hypothetical protein OBBRIDRAFT_804877 [Obba rivulosa]|uniref:Uncharacterized protein n=1 Tax=Obba rivulosa TaxID=1052685 RepID=A0A8E2ATV4_9APHY|nr:hypothetical protein OBBRIDRAFT_804877 [Obba rivulosa]
MYPAQDQDNRRRPSLSSYARQEASWQPAMGYPQIAPDHPSASMQGGVHGLSADVPAGGPIPAYAPVQKPRKTKPRHFLPPCPRGEACDCCARRKGLPAPGHCMHHRAADRATWKAKRRQEQETP